MPRGLKKKKKKKKIDEFIQDNLQNYSKAKATPTSLKIRRVEYG